MNKVSMSVTAKGSSW